MEAENIYDEVIIRYLVNESTAEEEQSVLAWMEADEKNRLYVEELGKVVRLIALKHDISRIDVEQEWVYLRDEILRKNAPVVHLEEYSEGQKEQEADRKGSGRIYRIIIAAAAAASVILLIGLGNGWFTATPQQDNRISQKNTQNSAKIDPLMAVVQHEINTSGSVRKFTLPDGSAVALFDSSELTYKEPVAGSRRDVFLTGKADFTVAKNGAKPFTVFSGDISTTAIGTVFTVTAKQVEKWIRVRLDEGKVVVRSLKGYNKSWKADFYMSPGQELLFDRNQQSIHVRSSGNRGLANEKKSSQLNDSPVIPRYDERSWFMFNNQSLAEVFDALAEIYGADIRYAKNDLKDKYFIGTYDKRESLESILEQIALLNNLKVTRLENGFKIEQQPSKK